jgi:virulence factor Mce-like protein
MPEWGEAMTGDGRRHIISPLLAGFLAGLAIAIVVGVMAKINIDFAAPWQQTHTLTAQVSDADGLAYGSDVRISGRVVGQVTGVQAAGDHADVTFKVDDSEWPLSQDTRASIRLATLLGQKYVELQPGTDQHRLLADDGVIGLQATKPVVDFDQILDTFDKPTRDSLTSLLRTLGSAVQGQEGTIQQILPTFGQLSVHSKIPTGELSRHDTEINAILTNLGTTADQFNRSREDLAGVIDNLNTITGALAAHQGAFEGYISNVDKLNQTTDAVLGNGGAAQLNAGLGQLGEFSTQLNLLLGHMITESRTFTATGADKAAISLVFEIGDATSQSNRSGFFLRQSTAGVDLCGLTPLCAPPAPPSSSSSSPTTLPPLPVTLPPALCQPVSGITTLPGCPTSSSGSTGGTAPAPTGGTGTGGGSGGGGVLPPLPTLGAWTGDGASASWTDAWIENDWTGLESWYA